jgi:4-carboxymuconolactone decarboxylase
MRLPLIPPSAMDADQRDLYDDIEAGIGTHFTAFVTHDPASGALVGPWNAMLHEPQTGRALWTLSKTINGNSVLPPRVREIAILVVGAHFGAAYELYAHLAVARSLGMSTETLSALCSGSRPEGLDGQESAAFEVAAGLVRGGTLPEPCHRRAVEAFGQRGANELFLLIGLYCTVAMLLNAHDVPVPAAD